MFSKSPRHHSLRFVVSVVHVVNLLFVVNLSRLQPLTFMCYCGFIVYCTQWTLVAMVAIMAKGLGKEDRDKVQNLSISTNVVSASSVIFNDVQWSAKIRNFGSGAAEKREFLRTMWFQLTGGTQFFGVNLYLLLAGKPKCLVHCSDVWLDSQHMFWIYVCVNEHKKAG